MELITTTVQLPSELYGHIARLAEQRHSSVDELVREACQSQFLANEIAERLAIVDRMAKMNLPVGTPAEMKAESVPPVEPLP